MVVVVLAYDKISTFIKTLLWWSTTIVGDLSRPCGTLHEKFLVTFCQLTSGGCRHLMPIFYTSAYD